MNDLSVMSGPYIQNYAKSCMRRDIPIPCPRCGGKMYSIGYNAPLKLLKPRSWQVCKECHFERSTEDFKKTLFCA